MLKFMLILLASTCCCCFVNAAIQQEDALNDAGEVVFQVFEDKRIKLPNRHRLPQPWLNLMLRDTTVERLDKVNSTLWTLSLSDSSKIDFVIEDKIEGANVTESYLRWYGRDLSLNQMREICFYYQHSHVSWYRGYQRAQPSWPVSSQETISSQQFNYLFGEKPTSYYVKENNFFILEHLFLNSDGFAILLDQYVPWFVSGHDYYGEDPMMCLSVQEKLPYSRTKSDSTFFDIKIRLFASANLRTVTDYVIHQSEYIPKPTKVPNEAVFRQPSWMLNELGVVGSADTLIFSSELANNGFYSWQTNGQRIIFPSKPGTELNDMLASSGGALPAELLIELAQKRGFEVGAGFSEPSLQFNALDRALYAITSSKPSNFIDLTRPEACRYFTTELDVLRFKKQLDYYMLSADMRISQPYGFNDTLYHKYPSLLTTRYIEAVSSVSNSTVISEYAFKTQHLPVWVKLMPYTQASYEQRLLDLIPNALSVSIGGYSFIMPYTVGGVSSSSKPSEEVFLRMIQAVAFMPAIAFGTKPWEYSFKTNELTKTYLKLHADHVPVMLELAQKRITDGSPIIRPMWYVAPDDARTYSIGDQYMLGDDIVVAPVLSVGQTNRTVYLPTGTWLDQHGEQYDGPAEFSVYAPLEELPYFKRKTN